MGIQQVEWVDETQEVALATIDDQKYTVPNNAHDFGRTGITAWLAQGNQIASPAAAPVSVADVVKERAIRLAVGFDYDFGDARGVHRIGTTVEDLASWREVTDYAQAAISLGAGSTMIQVVTDTGPVALTAMEWQNILLAAAGFRQPLYAASFALQAMDPIPADYATNESYWA